MIVLTNAHGSLCASYSLLGIGVGAASLLASASYGAQAVDEVCNGSANVGERAMGALLGVTVSASVAMQEHVLPVCLLVFAAHGVVDTTERYIVQKTFVQGSKTVSHTHYVTRKKVHGIARTIGALVVLEWYKHQDTTSTGLARIVCPAGLVAVLVGAAVGRVGVTPVLVDIFAQKNEC